MLRWAHVCAVAVAVAVVAAVWRDPQLPPEPSRLLPEYDFVVVGAGCAGSVLAARLSEVSNWTVALLEAGEEDPWPWTNIPLAASYLQQTALSWRELAEPDPGFCSGLRQGRCPSPRGRGLGGGCAINYMLYTRGARADWDEWAARGLRGWQWPRVAALMRRGGVPVTDAPWKSPLAGAFVSAARQATGVPETDPNGDDGPSSWVAAAQATLRRGSRASAAKVFLGPACGRPNLHVVRGARVTRVLLAEEGGEGLRALGVRLVRGGRTAEVRARREVLLTAGAVGSAHLLLLSGIGPSDHLREVGVEPRLHLPGVGRHLQDHVMMPGLAFTVDGPWTIRESRLLAQTPRPLLQWALDGNGVLTSPGGAEVLVFDNDVELVLGPGALSGDLLGSLRSALGFTDAFWSQVYGTILHKDAWSAVPLLLRPHSKGRVALRSADPLDSPLLEPGFFSDPRDLDALVRAIKLAVRVGEAAPLSTSFNSSLHRAPWPGCEHHDFGSDQYWACCTRRYASSLHHPTSTCRMGGGDDDRDSVLDDELRVRGVARLRVADSAAFPRIPAAHTMAPVFAIAERAADLVKTAHGDAKAISGTDAD